MKTRARVFLDVVSLAGQEGWDLEIPRAQYSSRVTVALISRHTGSAYYAREEIATAIALQRTYPGRHRLVPVYLDGPPPDPESVPYGLRLLNYLSALDGGMTAVATRLLGQAPDSTAPSGPLADPRRQTIAAHPLHRFPRGPAVQSELIPGKLIEAWAELVRPREAALVVSDANAFRIEADPEDGTVTLIKAIHLPDPLANASFVYWLEVFNAARLHGPRMLAALVLTLPSDMLTDSAKQARGRLLDALAAHPS